MLPETDGVTAARALLEESHWLRAFPPELRKKFLSRTRLLPSFRRGQRVYHMGDEADGIYGVVSGCFAFEIAGTGNTCLLAHQFRSGDWFGELACVLESPRLTSLYAVETSQCLRIGAADLSELLKTDPLLWRHLALSLADASVLAMSVVHDLMERSPRKRLASTLLRLAGLRRSGQASNGRLDLRLTHDQLAQLTSLSRGVVGQLLHELESEGHLECSYGRVALVNPASLRELSGSLPD